jgi:signal transduction histidine kinase
MTAASRPEAIDSRLVLHLYACVTIPAGLVGYMWPVLVGMTDTSAWLANGRVAAAAVAAVGCCAAGLGAIDDPVGRRRGLIGFAHAHILFGALLMAQSIAVRSATIPAPLAAVPVTIGLVLMYLAITGPGADFRGPLPALVPFDSKTTRNTRLMVRNKRSISYLRSQYEHDIRQAARQEERARLARDLHDAVKQQLFVIQTAAATAQARFDSDANGAKTAVDQVRAAAREAMTEMEAMLEQLQAAPLENAGLVASVRKQCDALGFRTGARVTFDVGTLPADSALDPGTRQALFRVAQEALANVARHARARNISVSLASIDGQLVLTVQDDGGGFKPEGQPRGMGMTNIAARAAEVGGNFEVVSVPDRGTTVRFSVPVQQQPYLKPYARRAIAWSVVLISSIVYVAVGARAPGTWLPATVVLIAGIAVARYAVAAYRLRRSVAA